MAVRKALVVANKKIDLEVNAEKNKYFGHISK